MLSPRIPFVVLIAAVGLLAGESCVRSVPAARPLSGQVFIVTKGRENIRLGLVNVLLYPESTMAVHLQRKEQLACEKLAEVRATIAQWRDSIVDAKQEARRIQARVTALEDEYIAGRITTGEWTTRRADIETAASRALARAKVGPLRDAVAESVYFSSNHYYLSDLPDPVSSVQTDADGRFTIKVPPGGRYVLTAHTERQLLDSKETYAWLVRLDDADFARGTVLLSNDNLIPGPAGLLSSVSP